MEHLKALAWSMIVPIIFYIGGYDFDERGVIALLCFTSQLITYLLASPSKPIDEVSLRTLFTNYEERLVGEINSKLREHGVFGVTVKVEGKY